VARRADLAVGFLRWVWLGVAQRRRRRLQASPSGEVHLY
jgi:hypothetical protein